MTKTLLSRRTVQRLIAKMVCSGWLVSVSNRTGRGHTNKYRIDPAWIAAATACSDVTTYDLSYPQGGQNDTFYKFGKDVIADRKGVSTDIKGVTAAPDPKDPLGTNTPLPPSGETDGFEEVFATYPKKTNSSKAHREWIRLAPDVELRQTMLEAIAAHSRTEKWIKDNGRFVPEFANWLRYKCWLDQVDNILNDWWTTIEGIKAKGEKLGMEYSLTVLGNSYTGEVETAHYRAYRSQVIQAAGEGPWSKYY